MSRLIDADALIAQMEADAEQMEDQIAKMFAYAAINDVKRAPTIEERKTGKWVGVKEYCDHLNEEAEREGKGNRYMPSGMNISVYCDQCWEPNDRRTTYCPNCGKRMVQGVEKDGLH